MDFGGILAGAMAGGAEAVGGMARGAIEDERRLNLERERAAIEEQMRLRLEEARSRRHREDRTWELTEGAKLGTEAEVRRQDALRPGEIETHRQKGAVEMDQYRQKSDVDVDKGKRMAEVEVDAAGRMPFNLGEGQTRYVNGKAVASKGKTYAPGTGDAATLTKMKLEDAAEERRLVREFDDATPERQEKIRARLALLRGERPNEFDVEKVTDYKLDPATGEVAQKTERTQRRRPGAAPATQQRGAALKVGDVHDGYRYLGGNPKDANSWAPAERSSTGTVR